MCMHDLLEVDIVFSHSPVILKNDQYLLEGTVQWLSIDQVMKWMASIMQAILPILSGPSGCGKLYHEIWCYLILF